MDIGNAGNGDKCAPGQADTVARLPDCNPFLAERVELERHALGPAFVPTGPVWHSAGDAWISNPNTPVLRERLESLVAAVHPRLATAAAGATSAELDAWRSTVFYLLWLRYEDDAVARSPVVHFEYPTASEAGFDYLRREVKLELGSLTDQQPTERHPVRAWVVDDFPAVFIDWKCEVTALELARTFWEKATILHAEHHRPEHQSTPDRVRRAGLDEEEVARLNRHEAEHRRQICAARERRLKVPNHGLRGFRNPHHGRWFDKAFRGWQLDRQQRRGHHSRRSKLHRVIGRRADLAEVLINTVRIVNRDTLSHRVRGGRHKKAVQHDSEKGHGYDSGFLAGERTPTGSAQTAFSVNEERVRS